MQYCKMAIGHLKETNFVEFLPRGLKDSVVCYTSAKCEVLDDSPDLVTCLTNGCLYETKNRKICRSLNFGEIASSVSCYFLLETGKIVLFYLVLTTSAKLMIIRRCKRGLKVKTSQLFPNNSSHFFFGNKALNRGTVQDYNAVKDVQVYDFECLGYPQIKITFLSIERNLLCKFPVEPDEEKDNFENSSFTGESLADELQIVNIHVDELTEEYNQMKKICFLNNAAADFEKILVDSVKFSAPVNEPVQLELLVTNKWIKVFGNTLILGMKISNTGNEIIHDIEVTINHEKIKDYAYSFFQSLNDFSNYLFSPEGIMRNIKPGEEIYAVVTFQVPAFYPEAEFVVPCYVTCSNLPEFLLKDTFEVKIQDVASGTTVGLEEHFTLEDLIAIKATKSEIHIKIRAEDLRDCSLESLLTENLGFKRIKHVKDKLFYCTSTFLKEVFVAIRHITVNPSVWKVIIFPNELSQVFFLVSALYDLLPETAAILCDED